MDNIKVNECDVVIDGKKISLEYPIKMVERMGDLYIILLSIPTRTELGLKELNNIICYNIRGQLIWRIDDKLPSQITSDEQTPYVAIQIQDNILKATDFFGRRFHINVEDGRLLEYEIVR